MEKYEEVAATDEDSLEEEIDYGLQTNSRRV